MNPHAKNIVESPGMTARLHAAALSQSPLFQSRPAFFSNTLPEKTCAEIFPCSVFTPAWNIYTKTILQKAWRNHKSANPALARTGTGLAISAARRHGSGRTDRRNQAGGLRSDDTLSVQHTGRHKRDFLAPAHTSRSLLTRRDKTK
jgi:hypothetical protein